MYCTEAGNLLNIKNIMLKYQYLTLRGIVIVGPDLERNNFNPRLLDKFAYPFDTTQLGRSSGKR